MKKQGIDELKKLFEQKQKKEKNNSSSKKKKKKTKEDKKKQEKLKKEKDKEDNFPQRTMTFFGNEIESARKNLIKNAKQNDKNDKIDNNNSNKETPNELEKIRNKLIRSNTNIIGSTNSKGAKAENNDSVKKNVNDNKDNKKEANSKNNISNLNKDNNKNGLNDVKKETKNAKNNITNIKNTENTINLSLNLDSVTTKSKSFTPVIKDNIKKEISNLIKTDNKVINENEKKVFEKSFDKLVHLQVLLKKESSLKELCKHLL